MNAPSNTHEMRVMTQLPDMGSGPVPVEPYISPEYFKREQEKIFRKAWINVGRVSSHVPNPGDYMVRDLEVLNTSVLIVHGRDGVVRVFHNVCTHRGNLVAKGSGNARSAFVCLFHGWAFGLDGSLKTVPSEEQFPGLDRGKYGLPKIITEVWNGFIFINAQDNPTTSLEEFLGGWGAQLKSMPFDKYDNIGRYTTRLKCNWKVYIDAFQEAYHAIMVHAESLGPMAKIPDVLVPTSVRTYGPHRSLSVWANPRHEPSPAEAVVWKCGGGFLISEEARERPTYANPSHDANWMFDINVCFPNFFVDVVTGFYFTYNFFPVSVDETFWEVNIYHLRASTPGQKIAQEYTKIALRDVLYEDLSTMEGVQQGLSSGALKSLILGEFEIAIRHQYWAVEQWLNAQ